MRCPGGGSKPYDANVAGESPNAVGNKKSMSWQSVSHGTTGLLLGNSPALLGLLGTLFRQRAMARLYLASPLLSLPCLLVGAIIAGILANALGGGTKAEIVSGSVLLLAGVIGGLVITRRRTFSDTHVGGTVVGTAGHVEALRPANRHGSGAQSEPALEFARKRQDKRTSEAASL
jgi:hypothetical protein